MCVRVVEPVALVFGKLLSTNHGMLQNVQFWVECGWVTKRSVRVHSICSLVCRNRHSGAGALVCCGASQLAVCSRKPESRPRRPLGQHPGSSIDAGASIRPGVHSHCTRVRYTHGRVHSHRTHVRYTHPKAVLGVISMCISGLCPMAVYLDVYIAPVSDARVPPKGCTQGS